MTNGTNWHDLGDYIFGCSCGEQYNNVAAAYNCRKCRDYCVFGYCTHVVNLLTGKVVAGTVPTEEQEAEAIARAEERRAEEEAGRLAYYQMMKQEGAAWDAHVARLAEKEREAAEDILWAIQDELNGFPSEGLGRDVVEVF